MPEPDTPKFRACGSTDLPSLPESARFTVVMVSQIMKGAPTPLGVSIGNAPRSRHHAVRRNSRHLGKPRRNCLSVGKLIARSRTQGIAPNASVTAPCCVDASTSPLASRYSSLAGRQAASGKFSVCQHTPLGCDSESLKSFEEWGPLRGPTVIAWHLRGFASDAGLTTQEVRSFWHPSSSCSTNVISNSPRCFALSTASLREFTPSFW